MKRGLFFLISLAILAACGEQSPQKAKQEPKDMRMTKFNDPHSCALPAEARVEHMSLDLAVSFEARRLTGKVRYKLVNEGAKKLMLDTRDLTIKEVMADGQPTTFTLHDAVDAVLGRPLEVDIKPETNFVTVMYETSPEAAGLMWLSPAQTADKKHPFLFSQSQAILARTWIPCQDSPGIRFTYDAKVQVPKGLMALMSAENPTAKNPDGQYTFTMSKPIPSYLLAIAVGDVAYQQVGPQTGVYAEPSMLEAAHYEFGDMEEMIRIAENLYGPYQWGRYDLIVLPPSFPFGGMENPMLTFATPTILAGDRSLVSLVAHELAHSWSGNLVTNATWDDFWLNEGFTTYFELRIMEALYGKSFANMIALIAKDGLQAEIDTMKAKSQANDTKLKLSLEGRDPDEGMTTIAYDKGYLFLRLCEQTVGREKWDAFLKEYFARHAFQTIDTEEFLYYLDKELLNKVEGAKADIRPEKWIYEAGLPDNAPEIPSDRFAKVEATAKAYMEGKAVSELDTAGWVYQEWVYFLQNLPDSISSKQLSELDRAFGFTQNGNNEILFTWLKLGLEQEYQAVYPKVETFLMNVGRRKFVAPLFKVMASNESQRDMAKRIYQKARPNYHSVTFNTVDDMLGM